MFFRPFIKGFQSLGAIYVSFQSLLEIHETGAAHSGTHIDFISAMSHSTSDDHPARPQPQS
jgi:hypothetical protein